MSGHSKWSTIKRAKGAADAKRGKIFTKIAREIMVSARVGGPNIVDNAALRIAIGKARQANMPKENVQRAIDRASTTGGGENWEEVRYEAYGPAGVALLIDTLTDNRNRTVSDVRSALTKAGGNLGETGSVAWTFEQKGVLLIDLTETTDAEDLELQAIDAGAEDVDVDSGVLEVVTAPTNIETVRDGLEGSGATIASAEVIMRPTNTVGVDETKGRQILRLIDTLEDLDDVQRVSTNADFPDSVLVEA